MDAAYLVPSVSKIHLFLLRWWFIFLRMFFSGVCSLSEGGCGQIYVWGDRCLIEINATISVVFCSLCIGGCSPGGFCSFRGVSRFWRILKIIVYMCMNLFIQEQDFNISQSISLTLTFKFWSLLLGKPRSFWRVMGFTEEQRSILYLERYIV